MARVRKISTKDRYDCLIHGRPRFINDVYRVSKKDDHFHSENVLIFLRHNGRYSSTHGVNKKDYFISPIGSLIDQHYVGKGNS